ncbi:MAG: hypothetical protein CMI16_03025 [Opitutaceae bacterium]|nr:hypothetical protein [Opitutaceae bacterium]
MLTRSSQVGEFYVMGPPPDRPPEGAKGFMDILIYNEESDRHVRITWDQALKATLASNAAGDGEGTVPCDIDGWLANARLLNAANKDCSSNNLNLVYPTNAANKKAYIVVARPFIEHLMHSAVVAVAGRDTGATLFGPAGVCSRSTPKPLTFLKGTPCRIV